MEGMLRKEGLLKSPDLYDPSNYALTHYLDSALKAHVLFRRDKDYVVKNGEVIIVDEFTGRLMPGRRYSEGLHQAIEAKERVKVQRETVTLATITFQNYFRLYQKLAGMTGTAATEAEEFAKIYKLDVVAIPTNRAMIRKDYPDQIYGTEEAKFKAVCNEIEELHKRGASGAGRHHLHRDLGAPQRHADAERDHPPGAERQAPREGGRHHRPGREAGRGHGRHQHGRPRRGHHPGRQP